MTTPDTDYHDRMKAYQDVAPVWANNITNSKPGFRFTAAAPNGYHDFMYGDAYVRPYIIDKLRNGGTTPTAFTLWAVFKPATVPTGSTQACIFSSGAGSLSSGMNINLGISATNVHFAVASSASTNSNAVLMTPTANGLIKVVARFTNFGTATKLAVNSLSEGSLTPTGTMNGSAWDYVYLASRQIGGAQAEYFDGWLHEIRIWQTAVTDSVRDDLLSYATYKWGSV